MTTALPHISICVCTYKRPELLRRLLEAVARLETGGEFTYSVVIADNDRECSAESVVKEFSAGASFRITYCTEPRQNIALARNKTVANAVGDYIAFIDDDEYPCQMWLLHALNALRTHKVDGVLGPMEPYFSEPPPEWVVRGAFFKRPRHATGYRIDLRDARTGNVLFARRIIDGMTPIFDERFGTGGEDVDFFRRMKERGRTFIWCDESIVHELVPPMRCSKRYLLRRGLLRGRNNFNNPSGRFAKMVISSIAVPAYSLMLPFCWLGGEHVFLRYQIKLYDHAARFLTMFGLNPVKERDMQ